jgi:hypothetical protein
MVVWERFISLRIFNTFRTNDFRIKPVNLVMLELIFDETSKLSVFSRRDNLGNSPGGE